MVFMGYGLYTITYGLFAKKFVFRSRRNFGAKGLPEKPSVVTRILVVAQVLQ